MTDIPPHIRRSVLGMASILTALIGRELAAPPETGRSSLPDAEVAEDYVEKFVEAHRAGDAAEGTQGQA